MLKLLITRKGRFLFTAVFTYSHYIHNMFFTTVAVLNKDWRLGIKLFTRIRRRLIFKIKEIILIKKLYGFIEKC